MFRLFRILRLFRLAKSFPKFRQVIIRIGKVTYKISSIIVLMFLSMFIFAIAGRIFFAGEMNFHLEELAENTASFPCSLLDIMNSKRDPRRHAIAVDNHGQYDVENKPRHHYDTLPNAMMTNFQIMTAENWPSVLYDTMKAGGYFLGAAYVCGSFVVNNYFILALLLAVLIDEFSSHSDDDFEA